MRWLFIAFAALTLTACGADFFPENTTTGAGGGAPDGFTFAQKTNVTLGQLVQSDAVTVTGSNSGGWTISVSDGTTGANSQYSINGSAFTSAAGTILPNQTLRIQQTAASTNSTLTTSKVTVGTFTTTFQSITATQ